MTHKDNLVVIEKQYYENYYIEEQKNTNLTLEKIELKKRILELESNLQEMEIDNENKRFEIMALSNQCNSLSDAKDSLETEMNEYITSNKFTINKVNELNEELGYAHAYIKKLREKSV